MKKTIMLLIATLLICLPGQVFSLTWTGPETLDDWTKIIYSGNPMVTPSGTTVSFMTDGGLGGIAEDFVGTVGVLATVNVSDASGTSYLCLEKAVGTLSSGNIITTSISVGYDKGERTIYGMLLERDPDTLDLLKQHVVVCLGDPAFAWSDGQDIILGTALVGQEIWYYTSASGYIAKFQPIDDMESSDNPDIYIYGGPNTGFMGDITATVKDVLIIYP